MGWVVTYRNEYGKICVYEYWDIGEGMMTGLKFLAACNYTLLGIRPSSRR